MQSTGIACPRSRTLTRTDLNGHAKYIIIDVNIIENDVFDIIADGSYKIAVSGEFMITAAQMRAARALLGIDQRQLAERSGVSLPTIQRMEASDGNVRGVIDTLTKIVEAFDLAGVELIGDGTNSVGQGRGVRFKATKNPNAGSA
jgi:DNA-binding XRE family transcriptional regulator